MTALKNRPEELRATHPLAGLGDFSVRIKYKKNAEEFAELIAGPLRRFFSDIISDGDCAQSLAPRAATAHRKTRRWTGA